MRRLGLVFSAIVLVATMSFGQSKKVNLVSDINFDKLSNYLQLKPSQMNEVASINEFFSEQLAEASRVSESRYDKKVHQAVYSNLKLMKGTLPLIATRCATAERSMTSWTLFSASIAQPA